MMIPNLATQYDHSAWMVLIIIQYNARNDLLQTAELVVKSVIITIFAQ